MNFMIQMLTWISDSLLVPVVVLLLALFLYSLVLLGGFFSLYLRLLGYHRELRRLMEQPDGPDLAALTGRTDPFAVKLKTLAELDWHPIRCEKKIAEFQQSCQWDLERPKFLIKIGPMLGLMGTLIPMGPALVGLAGGDLASMARNIQVAFTTTVVGIFIGAIGLITYSIKNHWYREEIGNLRYVLDLQLHRREQERR